MKSINYANLLALAKQGKSIWVMINDQVYSVMSFTEGTIYIMAGDYNSVPVVTFTRIDGLRENDRIITE